LALCAAANQLPAGSRARQGANTGAVIAAVFHSAQAFNEALSNRLPADDTNNSAHEKTTLTLFATTIATPTYNEEILLLFSLSSLHSVVKTIRPTRLYQLLCTDQAQFAVIHIPAHRATGGHNSIRAD